jgi:hypothetical protein
MMGFACRLRRGAGRRHCPDRCPRGSSPSFGAGSGTRVPRPCCWRRCPLR